MILNNKNAKTIFEKGLGISITKFKKLRSQNNKVYLINEQFIIKNTHKPVLHYNFLNNVLKNKSYLIPNIVYSYPLNKDENCIIYKLVSGECYQKITTAPQILWRNMGSLLYSIHSTNIPKVEKEVVVPWFSISRNWKAFIENFYNYKDAHLKLVPSVLTQEELDKIYAHIKDLANQHRKVKLVLLHGDYMLKNVVFKKNYSVKGIIDWESSQLGDSYLELGYNYLFSGLMTNWKEIQNGYEEASCKPFSEKELLVIKKYAVFSATILLSTSILKKSQERWVRNRLKNILLLL